MLIGTKLYFVRQKKLRYSQKPITNQLQLSIFEATWAFYKRLLKTINFAALGKRINNRKSPPTMRGGL